MKNNSISIENLVHLSLIPSLGSFRVRTLLNSFKTFEQLSDASIPQLCRVDGISRKLAQHIVDGFRDEKLRTKALKQVEKTEKYDTRIITFWDELYPFNLKTIYNPPLLLYVRGELKADEVNSIAIVGSRAVTEYGKIAADKISRDVAAKGITVVSGMATGIDTCAHWGALKANGRTVAVLGCGVDVVYPAENASLYKELMQKGAIISELPFGTKPSRGNFPARNRIISGMTLGTVVIEAGKKSGSLITASAALEQNKEVFAVPGNINNTQCAGSNRLIKEGAAKLVESAEDILDEIGPKLKRSNAVTGDLPETITIQLSDSEAKVYDLTGAEAVTVDDMADRSGLSLSMLATNLLTLELKGIIRKLPGNCYIRV